MKMIANIFSHNFIAFTFSYIEKFQESMAKLKCMVIAQKSTIRKKKKERIKKENPMKVKRYKEF
jgi:hypothetical protein